MSPKIGFVLLSFNLPEQTIALCRRLTDMFGDVPIALHHDFSQCTLDTAKLPGQVRLVQPHFRTGWGTFPVVEANFAALRLLYETGDPDWCVSLSTADYPVKSADRILRDLTGTHFDAFLDYRELVASPPPPSHRRDVSLAFRDPEWLQVAYNRYVAINMTPDRLLWRFPRLHRPRLLRGALAERLFTPFTSQFRPYGGDAWYTLNRKAAKVLPATGELFTRLRKHYLHRRVPEESIYQTILCNDRNLRICDNNLRFTDWSRGGSGPKMLSREDIPALIASPAHFARKFPYDSKLFGEIDLAAAAAAKQPVSEPLVCG